MINLGLLKKKVKKKDFICTTCSNKKIDVISFIKGDVKYYSCSCPTGIKLLSKMSKETDSDYDSNTISIKSPLFNFNESETIKDLPFGLKHEQLAIYCECKNCFIWRQERGFDKQIVDLTT